MHFFALVADYDETIAHHGRVADTTVDALERLRASGRRLLLVTGRELPELEAVFADLTLFDRIVAENGALVFDPATRATRALAPEPPTAFVSALRQGGIAPLSVGRVIVATREPHEAAVLEAIRSLGLELKIVFNKGAVMVLPAGVTKATGMTAALAELGLSPHNAIGVGDAENDYSFLQVCGAAVAVANALPMLKREATLVLEGSNGAGVSNLVDRILADETELIAEDRRALRVGVGRDGREIRISAHGGSTLISGVPGSGKSVVAKALIDAMTKADLQYCAIDSAGQYGGSSAASRVGGRDMPPPTDEGIGLLRQVGTNLIVNAEALAVADGSAFFAKFLPELFALRARCGRPHWLIVDEIGKLLATMHWASGNPLLDPLPGTLLVTVDVKSLPVEILRSVRRVIALGAEAPGAIGDFCALTGIEPVLLEAVPRAGEVLYWDRDRPGTACPISLAATLWHASC